MTIVDFKKLFLLRNISAILLFLFVFFSVIDYHYSRIFIIPLILVIIFHWKDNGNIITVFKNPMNISIFLFVGYMIISLIWTSDTSYGVTLIKRYAILFLIPFLVQLIKGQKLYNVAIYAYTMGVLKIIAEYHLIRMGFIEGYADTFIVANSYSYIHVGFILSPFVLIGLFQLFDKEKKTIIKLLFFIVSILVIITVFMMNGRGAQLALITGLFVFLLFSIRKNKIISFITLLILSVLFIFLNYKYNDTFQIRVNEAVSNVQEIVKKDNYNTSAGIRLALWKTGGLILKDNLFFGTGVGGQLKALQNKIKSTKNNKLYFLNNSLKAHFHNEFVEVFVQGGLIGGGLFISIFILIISSTYFKKIDTNLVFGVTGLIMTGLLTHIFLGSPKTSYFILSVLSITLASSKEYYGKT